MLGRRCTTVREARPPQNTRLPFITPNSKPTVTPNHEHQHYYVRRVKTVGGCDNAKTEAGAEILGMG